MAKRNMLVDVHNESIDISIAEEGRPGKSTTVT